MTRRSQLPDPCDLARAMDRTTDLSRLPDSYPRRTALDVALGLLIALFLAAGLAFVAVALAGYLRPAPSHAFVILERTSR